MFNMLRFILRVTDSMFVSTYAENRIPSESVDSFNLSVEKKLLCLKHNL